MRAPLLVVPSLVFLLGALAPGCGGEPETGPGSGNPGDPCTSGADCGCWSCTCQGIGGAPGGAQLCVARHCPTADAACGTVCDLVHAKVTSAKPADNCPGRINP